MFSFKFTRWWPLLILPLMIFVSCDPPGGGTKNTASDGGVAADLADSGAQADCGPSPCGACLPMCTYNDRCENGEWLCGCNCPDISECAADSECNGGTCKSLLEGEGRISFCAAEPQRGAHACEPDAGPTDAGPTDAESTECCQDSDCVANGTTGYCMSNMIDYCGGMQPEPANSCRYDDCETDADCDTGFACLAAGGFGYATRTCIQADCLDHGDCDGFCSLLYNGQTCPGVALMCNTLESECHRANGCDTGVLCVGNGTTAECMASMPAP